MRDRENQSNEIRRSHHNLLKMGNIAKSAMLAISIKAKLADAVKACSAANGCRCFLKGTTIRTADGDKRIEDLVAAGDLLLTVFGGMCPIAGSRASAKPVAGLEDVGLTRRTIMAG
jgi:hypothetical protein